MARDKVRKLAKYWGAAELTVVEDKDFPRRLRVLVLRPFQNDDENSRDYTDFSIDEALYRFKVCFSKNESEQLRHIEIVLKELNIYRTIL